jgi:hypothetical protein
MVDVSKLCLSNNGAGSIAILELLLRSLFNCGKQYQQ